MKLTQLTGPVRLTVPLELTPAALRELVRAGPDLRDDPGQAWTVADAKRSARQAAQDILLNWLVQRLAETGQAPLPDPEPGMVPPVKPEGSAP